MGSKNTGHILVVHDQDNWRRALSSLLNAEGHTVRAVGSFEDAIGALSEEEFDIVALDVRLVDDMDGFRLEGLQLLIRIKSQKPAPKVVILTGYPESIMSGYLERYEADGFVEKLPAGGRFDLRGFKQLICSLL